VVNNRMLYHEGWGVEAIKHSLTYSGGLSRGCVRGYAPSRALGFRLCSPLASPRVIAVSEAIPFADLTGGSHEALYDLKGDIVARGIRRHLRIEMPVFPKRRFQDGAFGADPVVTPATAPGAAAASDPDTLAETHLSRARDELRFRRHFLSLHA
jgi:asparagine synthase (glutamine-hydrolysing)